MIQFMPTGKPWTQAGIGLTRSLRITDGTGSSKGCGCRALLRTIADTLAFGIVEGEGDTTSFLVVLGCSWPLCSRKLVSDPITQAQSVSRGNHLVGPFGNDEARSTTALSHDGRIAQMWTHLCLEAIVGSNTLFR